VILLSLTVTREFFCYWFRVPT